ncbi:MAG TPA: XVIPCD domain-containing protein [Luteibacter sp.]|uniref:XVIPCD domain-containing protein n=1 Tax=Luteibacter sp. TaxID=1886636 RepID=UPI002BB94E44|nr:XVIPCD domain-containing protein [Luteibacter sp.]HVI55554.1 XVIPCD domain-containing protein [Luteibacter sp.]
MSRDIYNEANEHFLKSGRQYEYGRPDMSLRNRGGDGHTDSSRTEQDNDHDGRLGVDCSSFVWRGMHDAGYGVPATPFGTHDLFEGHTPTHYAREHFDVISAAEAHQKNGSLQPGDVLMFRDKHGSGQHVAIFKGYDAEGHIHFIGSQVGSGPAEVNVTPGGYWDGKNMEIVGALRAKPEFRVRDALHGHAPDAPGVPAASTQAVPRHTVTHAAAPTHEAALRHGDEGAPVRDLQATLNRLGYKDEHNRAIQPDGDFGAHTKAAVERFQRAHGLPADGVVGPATREALHTATPRLDAAGHPHHALYQQSRDAVHRLDAQHQRTPDLQSDQIAGTLTTKALGQGMTRVDHAVLNEDASKVYAVQGELNSPFKKVAEATTQEAANTPLEESSRQALQVAAQQAQQPAVGIPVQTQPPLVPSQSA